MEHAGMNRRAAEADKYEAYDRFSKQWILNYHESRQTLFFCLTVYASADSRTEEILMFRLFA